MGTTGPQGPQGPPGEVLVVDGGVVTGPRGPAGASIVITPVPMGSMACANGGVRVSLEDGGAAQLVCNGVAGATGTNGATGAAGPAGPSGAAGRDVAIAVEPSDAGCPTGGVRLTTADGGTAVVCNGANGTNGSAGPAGPAGMPGATGTAGTSVVASALNPGDTNCPQGGTRFVTGNVTTYACSGAPGTPGAPGAAGPSGPPGPAGPALLFDGGVLSTSASDGYSFAGYTVATYTGNLGAIIGANGKCALEFAGSHLCTNRELTWAGPPGGPGANGAWIDFSRSSSSSNPNYFPRDRDNSTCGDWTKAANSPADSFTYSYLQSDGRITLSAYDVCQVPRQLACCRSPHTWFRGYTTAKYNGNLGATFGANGKCAVEFPGSHLCTNRELTWAGPPVGPGADGAWIDFARSSTSSNPNYFPRDRDNSTCGDWTKAANSPADSFTYSYLQSDGRITLSAYDVCQVPRQLACCGG